MTTEKRTKEEIKAYYANKREQWKKAKELSSTNKYKALYEIYVKRSGQDISMTSFAYVAAQMEYQNLEGLPYLDCMTFDKWIHNGFKVKKGSKSTLDGLVWRSFKTESEDEVMFPKTYNLFHRSQVEAIAVELAA